MGRLTFNPVTGNLDLIGDKLLPNGTTTPTNEANGYTSLVEVSPQDGRIYFFVNGSRYYIIGTYNPPAAPVISIKRGQPVGMMGVTYAGDVN